MSGIQNKICLLALGSVLALSAISVRADDSALLDVLVKKGILTQQEAEKLESEVSKEPVRAPPPGIAANIKIGDWIQELTLFGDMRFREYYQTYQQELPTAPVPNFNKNIQNQRLRFRLRLDADFKLANSFFGAVELTTSDNRAGTSTNASYTGGFDNYNVYISRAFLGWEPTDGLVFLIGKQNNPFYTTELNWAADEGLAGLVERVDFHRLFAQGSAGDPAGDSKKSKTPPPPKSADGFPLELSLIAGQFIFFNNNADSSLSFNKTDAYIFDTQLLARLKLFGGNVAITFGPQIQIWNDRWARINRSAPERPTRSSDCAEGRHGKLLGTLNNAVPFPVSTRDEFYLQSPGDITFTIGKIPIKIYWDTSYNVWGPERFSEVYGPLFSTVTYKKGSSTPIFSNRVSPTFQDYFAWLAGIKVGQNKKAGDLSLLVDYRQIGLAATDPNINSNDFNLSYMNAAGWRASIACNLTDFAVLQVTGWFTNNLDRNLYGGYATSPSLYPLANATSSQTIAIDLSFRF